MIRNRKNLIITRAGSKSLHPSWVEGTVERNFDLLVAAYDEKVMTDQLEDVQYFFIPGYKVEGWSKLFKMRPDLLNNYAQFAFIDDDIAATAEDLNSCFEHGPKYGLDVWQPSLSWDSYATYAATLTNPNYKVRFVNYVEMMCPFFSSSHLAKTLPLFSLGFETAIDLIWCSLTSQRNRKFAIIDDVVVKHTRPVGGQKSENGFIGKSYDEDIYRFLDLFSATWPSCVSDAAIDQQNNTILGTFRVGFQTLRLLGSICNAPAEDRAYRTRCVTDHIRHQFTREPKYVQNAVEILANISRTKPQTRALHSNDGQLQNRENVSVLPRPSGVEF